MLCVFPTTAKSSGRSDWLSRLRSAKGFPDSDQTSLEQFLSNSLHQIGPQTTHPYERLELDENLTTEIPGRDGQVQERDVMSNVLSELFHMGEYKDLSRIRRKKSCRKQPCPRICVISSNSDAEDVPAQGDTVSLPLPLGSSNLREVDEELKERREHGEEKVEEEERGHVDLSAYSQTEVTIIDMSAPSWKFEKTLFRRKNVWKVGDKKGKGLMSGDRKKKKKKKKACLNENGDAQKKKLKLCTSSSKNVDGEEGRQKKKKLKQLSSSSKYVDKEKPLGHDQVNKTMVAEKKQDNAGQYQEKSYRKKQIDEDSPVVLIKSIPTTNRKNVSSFPKSCVKSIQK